MHPETNGNTNGGGRGRGRPSPYPSYHTMRKKPRRWPLVLRFFIKGAIHGQIAIAVILHAWFTAVVCFLDQQRAREEDGMHWGIPPSVVPSLSIVVGLMLVFRNSTSYDRFWQGNQLFATVETNIRNLTRSFLTCSHSRKGPPPTPAEKADTERAVRILLALIYAIKHQLRAEWGASIPTLDLHPNSPSLGGGEEQEEEQEEEAYATLLPPTSTLHLPTHESHGLSPVLPLSIQIESYIQRGHDRNWFPSPQASQLQVQLHTLIAAYGSLETIHLTPLPVAYLIHMRQVLAIFCCVLPFAWVEEMGWWAVLMVGFVAFTLYGIEAIGKQLEDPFGYDRADIKVDAIVEDLRVETMVLLDNWRRNGDIFRLD